MVKKASDRQKRGMAMVEMVFVLPLLLLLVFAIAELGLLFKNYLTLNNAVREGARLGAMFRGNPAQCNAIVPLVATQVQTRVTSYARAGGIPLQDGDVTVTGACAAAGTEITVRASYLFPVNIPFARIAPVNLRFESAMRNEG